MRKPREKSQVLKALDHDEQSIGTPEYAGLAYFGHESYRAQIRSASCEQRQLIHAIFLSEELNVNEASPRHEEIIGRIIGRKPERAFTSSF